MQAAKQNGVLCFDSLISNHVLIYVSLPGSLQRSQSPSTYWKGGQGILTVLNSPCQDHGYGRPLMVLSQDLSVNVLSSTKSIPVQKCCASCDPPKPLFSVASTVEQLRALALRKRRNF